MDTGESAAERQVFAFAGTCLLVIMAIVGAVFLVAGGRAVAEENRSAGVFPAQVLVARKAPDYEVAFAGPDGVVRADVTSGNKHRYRVGDRMDVRYWPDQHRIERADDGARFAVGFGALLVVVGLGGAGYRVVRARRRRMPA
ncbi:DUF3592 domain-containing protein [Amycolatopsis sp. NPDC049688]|uniref:DUF3592 domain-containing protein n=1 Tax=Amycolatopsis sp. NPDC049688 TaxID=3154733 RepID=UPI003426AC70